MLQVAGNSSTPLPPGMLTLGSDLTQYQSTIDTLPPSSEVQYFTENSSDLLSRLEPLLGATATLASNGGAGSSQRQHPPSLDVINEDPSALEISDSSSYSEVQAPYNVSPLRTATSLSPDMDASILLTSPAINEATAILDATAPAKLNGKIGREGNAYLQKTLELLAYRQLALPLGKINLKSET